MSNIEVSRELAFMLVQDLPKAGYKTLGTISNENLSCIYAKLFLENDESIIEILELSKLQKIRIPINTFRVSFHPDLVAKVLNELTEN